MRTKHPEIRFLKGCNSAHKPHSKLDQGHIIQSGHIKACG